MPKSNLVPRKLPRQDRSQAMVATIFQAAARVLATESLQGFNTNRVAEVAGVSVGSIYQYFPNKAALVAALIEEAQTSLAQALESAVQAVAGRSLEDSLEVLAQVAIDQQYHKPLLAAALDHEERRLPVHRVVSDAEQRILACVTALLQRHRKRLPRGLPAAAARDCLVITKAMVEADSAVARRPPEDLAQRIVRALMGYLTWAGRG